MDNSVSMPVVERLFMAAPQWVTLIIVVGMVLRQVPLKDLLKRGPTTDMTQYVRREDCDKCMGAVGKTLDLLREDVKFVRDALVSYLLTKGGNDE